MARPRKKVEPVNRAQAKLLQLGVTGSDIARKLGVTAPAVQRWLAGSGLPSHAQRQAIEKHFKVTVADWVFAANLEEHLEQLAAIESPPLSVFEDAERRLLDTTSARETCKALEVIYRRLAMTVADALQLVSERDLVYCHAGYRTMRETLLRLLAADAHFYGEASVILPAEPEDGPVAKLREARKALEELHAKATERAQRAIAGADFTGANQLDKMAAKLHALLRRARLDSSNLDKLFKGEIWTRMVHELSALLREDAEALEMSREWLEELEDPFSRRMYAELRQVRHITWPCVEFQTDPERFVRIILGQEPWEKQIEIMNGVRDNPRFACRSGHRIGKSYALAWIMLWLYSCWPGARVFFTNSTERQVEEVNWVEVRRAIAGSGVCLECKKRNKTLRPADQVLAPCPHSAKIEGKLSDRAKGGLHSPDFRQITGFTAKDAESTAGLAGENIFFLIDEASGVAQAIFIAIEGNRAGGAKLALFGNPTRNEGELYEAFHGKSKHYFPMTVSSWETPNAVSGHEIIKGLATKQWCEEMAEIWGKDDPLYKMRVLGVHVIGEDGRLIPASVIADAQERWLSECTDGRLYVGLDVAGPTGTGDESVFAPRRGNKIIELRARRGLDEDGHLAELLEVIAAHGRKGECAVVNVDSESIGAGIVSRLRQYEATHPGVFRVYAIKGSSNAIRQPKIYDRLRDEVGANLAHWIRHGGAIPSDPKLEKELHVLELKMKLLPTKGERSKLIGKDILKKLLGRSPDRADAAALAVWDQELGEDDVQGEAEDDDVGIREEGGQLDPFTARDAFDPYA